MNLSLVSDWLRQLVTMRLRCRNCAKLTDIGLDAMLDMSAKNDDFAWWRERFKCGDCGAKEPLLSVVPTHLAPRPYDERWNPLTQRWEEPQAKSNG